MAAPSYIVIEGPIGVGKTTLTKLLAGRIGADLLLEEVEANPFLSSFYKEPDRYAFQTQLFFLLSRYKQQEALRQQPLFGRGLISDYLFAKDRIFAHLTLGDDELALYEKVFKVLDAKVVRPDLVVYLQATPEVLLQRVRGRGHEFERPIKESYLENLVKSYNHFFFHYTDTPLLVVNTSEIDIVRKPDDLSQLVKEIMTMRGGTKHYLPLSK
jgi:deoxyadenosine/deoxycytidine kinase